MKKTHIIALVLLAVAFAVIIGMVNDYSSYESFVSAAKNEHKEFHVAGTLVKEKELIYQPEINPNLFTFYMLDREGNERKVICNADKPRDFELSEEIVVIGKMKKDVFYASQLLTKCPSKYVDEEIAIKSNQ
jgi:cytochrome c-type biogenesis protein CcmE